LLITNLHSKGLERSIGDVSEKKGHYLIFKKSFGIPNECHFGMSKWSRIPFWFILE
jgi:hypothetical protein